MPLQYYEDPAVATEDGHLYDAHESVTESVTDSVTVPDEPAQAPRPSGSHFATITDERERVSAHLSYLLTWLQQAGGPGVRKAALLPRDYRDCDVGALAVFAEILVQRSIVAEREEGRLLERLLRKLEWEPLVDVLESHLEASLNKDVMSEKRDLKGWWMLVAVQMARLESARDGMQAVRVQMETLERLGLGLEEAREHTVAASGCGTSSPAPGLWEIVLRLREGLGAEAGGGDEVDEDDSEEEEDEEEDGESEGRYSPIDWEMLRNAHN